MNPMAQWSDLCRIFCFEGHENCCEQSQEAISVQSRGCFGLAALRTTGVPKYSQAPGLLSFLLGYIPPTEGLETETGNLFLTQSKTCFWNRVDQPCRFNQKGSVASDLQNKYHLKLFVHVPMVRPCCCWKWLLSTLCSLGEFADSVSFVETLFLQLIAALL